MSTGWKCPLCGESSMAFNLTAPFRPLPTRDLCEECGKLVDRLARNIALHTSATLPEALEMVRKALRSLEVS